MCWYPDSRIPRKIQTIVCRQLNWEKTAIPRKIKELTPEEKRKLKKLAQIIRAERERQGLTLYEIEDRGFGHYQHWQYVESGERNLMFTTLLSICAVLKKHPSELLKDL